MSAPKSCILSANREKQRMMDKHCHIKDSKHQYEQEHRRASREKEIDKHHCKGKQEAESRRCHEECWQTIYRPFGNTLPNLCLHGFDDQCKQHSNDKRCQQSFESSDLCHQ